MKKTTRALLAIAIAVPLAVSLLTFTACSNGGKANDIEHISTKGLEYAAGAEENTCVVVGIGTAVEKDVIIPGVYQGKKVVGIKDKAFRENNTIRSVEIPDSVTSIGNEAFYGCRSL
ncbi:MAG: leucine-rich repeat protein, partial [Firmicutes bacterium]|nr:leucine-rich repeat protein [Bacillota bacterium]MDY5531955.1 leucine-rich repeat protein [Pumilibacteraceae bacterium]